MQDWTHSGVLLLIALGTQAPSCFGRFWISVRRAPAHLCRRFLGDRCVSLQVYWREYRLRLGAVILAIAVFFSIVGWLVVVVMTDRDCIRVFAESFSWMTAGQCGGQVANPFVLLLGYGIAIFTGTYLSGSLADLRATGPHAPLEQIEDQTTKPWRYTNHSFPDIRWSPDIRRDHRKAVETFSREQECLWSRGIFRMFERLLEETGTDNYRVFSFLGPARLIRIDKVTSVKDLECRRRVVAHLKTKSVFRSEFLRCLEPLPLKNPDCEEDRRLRKKTLSESCFAPDKDVWIQMFPYLDIDTHYRGKEECELKSVAAAFGRLQAALQSPDLDNPTYLKANSTENPLVGKPRTAIYIEQDWKKILCAAKKMEKKRPENTCVEILTDESELKDTNGGRLTRWVEGSANLRDLNEEKFLLLHDVHPHNVLCKNDGKNCECVLIYDYTWIGEWPHAWIVAFSLHRFVREYAIRNAKKEIEEYKDDGECPKIVRAFCGRCANIFLESYSDHCSLPLPENFRKNLGAYIRCSNMDKMLDAFEKRLGLEEDIRMRTEERRLGEVRKFVRFMIESEAFE